MPKLVALIYLLILSGSIYGETPDEVQGVWVPDVEKTIILMSKNMGDIDAVFMRDRYLPNLKRTIIKDQYIHASGEREYKASISLKEKKGNNFVMILTSKSAPDMLITFIPKEKDLYIMMSEDLTDGSGNILWRKQ